MTRTCKLGLWASSTPSRPNLSWDVSYVGSHGSRLESATDINQGIPVPGSGGPSFAAPLPYAAQYPYLSYIEVLSNKFESNYNGLQTTLQQRTSHGLSFLASYTYSHALDDDSIALGQYLPQDSTHPGREYASGDFDITHRFTFSLTYALPGRKSPGQLLEGLGAELDCEAQTGQPWYANDSRNNISGIDDLRIGGTSLATTMTSSLVILRFPIAPERTSAHLARFLAPN